MSRDNLEKSVAEWISDLGASEEDTRVDAIRALGEIADVAALKPLLATLKDTEPYVRRTAVHALQRIGTIQALEPIIDLLEDADDLTREVAANALGSFDDDRAVAALMRALDDKSSQVGFTAGLALSELGARGVPELLGLLVEGRHTNHASIAMHSMTSPEAEQHLLFAMRDENPRMRAQAARFLGKYRTPAVIATLCQALKDPDEDVRHFARLSLDALGIEDPEEGAS